MDTITTSVTKDGSLFSPKHSATPEPEGVPAGWRGIGNRKSVMNRTFTFSLGGLILLIIIVAILF